MSLGFENSKVSAILTTPYFFRAAQKSNSLNASMLPALIGLLTMRLLRYGLLVKKEHGLRINRLQIFPAY